MLLPIVATVQHEMYTPGPETPDGLTPDGWSTPATADSHGWYPPSADRVGIEPGRRDVACDMILMVAAGTVCGDKDRWSILGEGTFLQDGRPADYSHGPFGMQTPLVVYLKRVEG